MGAGFMKWRSAIFEGWVRHRRMAPISHAFRQRLFMMYLDLDELPKVLDQRWLWSARSPALASFQRGDYLGPPRSPLAAAVRDLVQRHLGRRPEGPIRLLTHVRYAGLIFNPVSVYYCFDQAQTLDALVLEVHNTPWGERHEYVLDLRDNGQRGSRRQFRLSKALHVSPFLAMNLDYYLGLIVPAKRLVIHLACRQGERLVLDATLHLVRKEITNASLTAALLKFPLMTTQVLISIYWQAFRLWCKGVPMFAHPSGRSTECQE